MKIGSKSNNLSVMPYLMLTISLKLYASAKHLLSLLGEKPYLCHH